MRTVPIEVGEYYHIFNRGVLKQNIFRNERDYVRFLCAILYLQSPVQIQNLNRHVSHYVKHSVFNISEEKFSEIENLRQVELNAFCFMPNHFHLLLKEKEGGGIARYMQRILNGYTKYFNTKYNVSGHLLQGPYKAVHVHSNEQLLYLSAYIHRNPREIPRWKDAEMHYPWSSYQDYTKANRWGNLLERSLILNQFSSDSEYQTFIATNPAKEASDLPFE